MENVDLAGKAPLQDAGNAALKFTAASNAKSKIGAIIKSRALPHGRRIRLTI
jgi:hypothetical protein